MLVGCEDTGLITDLHAGNAYVVHAIDTDSSRVEKARAAIQKKALYGKASATTFDGKTLPYADSLVNLLVLGSGQPGIELEELKRVLAPRGVVVSDSKLTIPGLLREKSGEKYLHRKPVPESIDDWTHYLYSPNNHAVGRDTDVAPPRHYQWIGKPRYSRSHDHLSSVSAIVSAKGRVFSIVDEGSIAFAAASPRWKLVARDAFNGIRLWEKEIEKWEYHLRDFRSGPADIARRLVAVGDTVYVTLGYDEPVVALDAASGELIRTFKQTPGTTEILCEDDTLLLLIGMPDTSWESQKAKETVRQENYSPPFEKYTPPAHSMRIEVVSASSGKTKWTNGEAYTRHAMPATLTLSEGRVFFHNLDELICLDAESGELLWKAPRPIERHRLAWSSPTVVAYEGIVYAADRGAETAEGDLLWLPSGGYHQYIKGKAAEGKLIAYDAKDGKLLWECPAYEGFNSAVDIFIIDGLLWTGRYAWSGDPGINQGRDPKTGEVKVTRAPYPMRGHARCHRAKCTLRYLIVPGRSVEMIDVKTGKRDANSFVRGNCGYGIMPANGLIYVPPHACACAVNNMLNDGIIALAPGRPGSRQPEAGNRLIKGPAYAQASTGRPQRSSDAQAWPTYRQNPARHGSTTTSISSLLKESWTVSLRSPLTPPVSDGRIVLLAEKDAHTVHALGVTDGEKAWSFTAGARIDSPPTIAGPLCIFGSRDGYVYCLRMSDGVLAWKFRAGPFERIIQVDGQLESAWPVPGNILVEGNTAYFVAGRTAHLDGGMYLYKLDVRTGEVIKVVERTASNGRPDVLASDGTWIFMRGEAFSGDLDYKKKAGASHLWSSVGFLDHNWWHRTYWLYGHTMGGGWGGWHKEAQKVPVGRILVTDGRRIYGYGRSNYDNSGAHVGYDGRYAWGPVRSPFTFYRLFGRDLVTDQSKPGWSNRIPVLGQALLLTKDVLFIAGPENPAKTIPKDIPDVDPLVEAIESDKGGKLLAVSPSDGKIIEEMRLKSPPVFDGMIAADGQVFISHRDGSIAGYK